MKIKKYTAPTLKQAAEKMKTELGQDAIILSTRIINADETDGPKSFEVIAGIEENGKNTKKNERSSKVIDIKPESDSLEELKKIATKMQKKELRKTNLNKPLNTSRKRNNKFDLKEELNKIGSDLLENEVQKPIVTSVLKQLYEYKDFLNKGNLEKYLLMVLSSMMKTQNFKLETGSEAVKVAFVGPTGVGKTTCIAKLATISKILHNLNVGIISIDTYRLGAIDQLRIFSDIVDIDMLVAYEAKEMESHLKTFKNKDIIFIDTAGRSQNNTDQLNQNLQFLNQINIDFKYLVLSATTSSSAMIDIAEKFRIFDYESIILSKLDEGVAYGSILNLLFNTDKPAVYLTNGQVIPDDIISADPEYLAKLVYKGRTE